MKRFLKIYFKTFIDGGWWALFLLFIWTVVTFVLAGKAGLL